MNTITQEYPQGVWCIDKNNQNMAFRISNDTTLTIPLNTEILEEMKKQLEASKVFNAFQQVSLDNVHIIGYLNLILDDYVNFLDKDSLTKLLTKMKQIEETNYLDPQNATYINHLRTSLEIDNIENFYDALEQFQSYNSEYFASILENNKVSKIH